MSEKRFKVLSGGFDEEGNPLYLIKDTTDMIGDWEMCKKVIEQQDNIDKQELRLQQLEELLELSQNLNKSYREKLIDMNLKMVIDDEL